VLYDVNPGADASAGAGASWDVVALHQGEIGGFVLFYLNEDLVELDNGTEGSVVNILDPKGNDGRYSNNGYIGGNDFCMVDSRVGLATETAYSTLATALPTLWSSSHRGDGIASLRLRCSKLANAEDQVRRFPRGVPRPSVVADLSAVWDPRDGGQDRDDPTTWTVSTNPVLQLIDYLTSGAGYGEVRGPDLDYDELIAPVIDAWMAEADVCDELITKADELEEVRYASNGWAFLTTDPADVIQAILSTCDGWMTEAGDGTLALKVGKYTAPTVTFTDEHLVAVNVHYGVADEDATNELRITYTAPGNHYREAPGVAWQDATSIAELGRIRSSNLTLTWVQSHSQARRLAKRHMARQVAPLRGSLSTTLYGLQAIGHRFVAVQSEQMADFADAVIEIVAARIDIVGARVTFEWVLVDPDEIDAWDPDTEEGTAPDYFPVPGTAGASPSFTLSNPGGSVIRVQFSDPLQDQLSYAVEYRVGSSGPWTRQTFAPGAYSANGTIVSIDTAAVTPATYNVRVAGIGAQGTAALGNWSSLAGTSVTIT
jgi:hypothetical protein